MKRKSLLVSVALGASLFLTTSGANAALVLTLNGKGVYDTDLYITWLRDANLAATNTFGVSGISSYGYMNWYTAQSWIGAMNTANYLGYNDWRLPTTTDIGNDGFSGSNLWDGTGDKGYNVTSSEMGHLYYTELGNLGNCNTSGNCPQPGWGLTITGPFSNIQSSDYWSGTEFAPNSNAAWGFFMDSGYQTADHKLNFMSTWAVRDGDSPAVTSPVPEPENYAMLLAGLGLLSFTMRHRKNA